jgi:hypothetical protein
LSVRPLRPLRNSCGTIAVWNGSPRLRPVMAAFANRSLSERMSQSFKLGLIEQQPYRMRLISNTGDVLVFQVKPILL